MAGVKTSRSRSTSTSSIPVIPGILWSMTKQLQSFNVARTEELGAAVIGADGKSLQLKREFQRAAHGRIVVDDRNNGPFYRAFYRPLYRLLGALCHR